MQIKEMLIEKLVPDPSNARVHGERNLEAIKVSIESFGQVEPLIVNKKTGIVIGGNGRLEVMRSLGWKTCEVVEVDLSATESQALGVALNRTAELAEWDLETLSSILEGLSEDTPLVGFTEHELENLIGADWDKEDADGEPEEYSRETQKGASKADGSMVFLTSEQFSILSAALEKLRKKESDDKITLGTALVMFSEHYFSVKR